jgi:colanic acid/amylovoran biosynthesis glycosyltransferase
MSRIIYLTVRAPLGSGEEFIIPEMLELLRQKHGLLIVPRSPSGLQAIQAEAKAIQPCCVYQPLLSWVILRSCIKELVGKPLKCLRLFLRIFFRSGTPLHLLKNLVVFPKALWLGRLARAWQAEHLHAHWALSTSTMAMIAGELTDIPWSFTAHRGDIVDNNMFEAKVRSAAFVRFISDNGFDLAKSVLKDIMPTKCHVIHMGVDLPIELSSSKRDVKKGFTIMCPANLLPVKGHTYLLQAVAALETGDVSCQLLLAGQGPMLGSLERQVDELKIQDRVKFLGQIPHSELLQFYGNNRVDSVVIPSIDQGNGFHEGIPVSLLEAMAYKIPVIATTTGGIPELITEGTGILVPPQDSNALATAIQRLIVDPDLRGKLALSGNQRVNEEFNIRGTVESLGLLFASPAQ